MLRVGLTGGLASGKSFVGRTLAGLGCHLIQADELGHQVLAKGGAAYEAVVREFGRVMLDESGEIDRRRLAGEVFGTPQRLETLNKIVHPHVFNMEEELYCGGFAERSYWNCRSRSRDTNRDGKLQAIRPADSSGVYRGTADRTGDETGWVDPRRNQSQTSPADASC